MTTFYEFASLVDDIEGFLNSHSHFEANELIVNARDAINSELGFQPKINTDVRLSDLIKVVQR